MFLTVLHRLFSGGSDRAADRWRLLPDRGVEGLDLQSSLPRDRRSAEYRERTGRGYALRAALPQRRCRGGPVRAAARALQHARSGVPGHHHLYFESSGRPDAWNTRFIGPISTMILAVLLERDADRSVRRCGPETPLTPLPDPGGRSAAQALFCSRVCLVADRGVVDDARTGGARSPLYPGRS